MGRRTKGGPSGPTQTYAERVARGRRQIAIFLSPEEAAEFDQLGEMAGVTSPRDVVVLAVHEAVSRRLGT